MATPSPALFFDFTDPLSYLVDLELSAVDGSDAVTRIPFELRPPPEPLVAVDDPEQRSRWLRAKPPAAELGVALAPPDLVPWSRKAHELHLFAASLGAADLVRQSIFRAFFVESADIGRVDVLVEIGRSAGMDATETKAVLDVDKYEEAVVGARASALALGVVETPTLLGRSGRWEGFHNRTALGTFLRDSVRPTSADQ